MGSCLPDVQNTLYSLCGGRGLKSVDLDLLSKIKTSLSPWTMMAGTVTAEVSIDTSLLATMARCMLYVGK